MSITTVQNRNLSAFLSGLSPTPSRGVLGTNPNGEAAAYLAGERRCKDVCVFLNVILDNSGSMNSACGSGKTRLQVALDCLNGVVKDSGLALARPDSLVVHTFNKEVLIRLCCHPADYNHQRLVSDITGTPGNIAGTRMRDAIFAALDNMEKHREAKRAGKEVVRFLLLLTDGADEGSQRSMDELLARLRLASSRLKNLNLVIIAAGLQPAALKDLERMCGGPVKVTVIQVQTVSDVNIKQAFTQAMEHLRVLLYRTPQGQIHSVQYVGRDLDKARRFDEQAAAAMSGFKNTQVLTGAEGLKQLMLEMGGGSGSARAAAPRTDALRLAALFR